MTTSRRAASASGSVQVRIFPVGNFLFLHGSHRFGLRCGCMQWPVRHPHPHSCEHFRRLPTVDWKPPRHPGTISFAAHFTPSRYMPRVRPAPYWRPSPTRLQPAFRISLSSSSRLYPRSCPKRVALLSVGGGGDGDADACPLALLVAPGRGGEGTTPRRRMRSSIQHLFPNMLLPVEEALTVDPELLGQLGLCVQFGAIGVGVVPVANGVQSPFLRVIGRRGAPTACI
mmetsp:Transcript_34437/g.46406  ORF Transcript_34437/g.46406 Transcript_34437/m.46406 type:complete len:228 (-) Transcript_34437:280-963(-)